jgi:hypothetical protein
VNLSLGSPVVPRTGEHADLFELTNRSTSSCALDGYPGVRLSHGSTPLAFVYARGGGTYVTTRQPGRVTVAPGHPAYFLVAQYRCDGGVLYTVTSIRVSLPGTSGSLSLSLGRQGVSGLDYCKRSPGDARVDPGNHVTVSPVEASAHATPPQGPQ